MQLPGVSARPRRSLSRDQYLANKRNFFSQCPIHWYRANPAPLNVQCSSASDCAVTVVVTWDCTSFERGVHGTGTSSFAMRFVKGVMVPETGSLTNHFDRVR
jgi:hypothetical protein